MGIILILPASPFARIIAGKAYAIPSARERSSRYFAPSLDGPITFARLRFPLGMAFHRDPNRMKRARLSRGRLKTGDVLAMDLLAEFVDLIFEPALLQEIHGVRSSDPRKEIGGVGRVEMDQFVDRAHEI